LANTPQAIYSVELGKPSLTWTLVSKGSELCQALGYHRSSTFTNELSQSAVRKQTLFWTLYTLDKSLSLRLGRSSTIQDRDITIPDPQSHDNPLRSPYDGFFDLWVAISRLQGHIYELLYCPDALRQSEEVRRSRAQQLANRLDELDRLTAEATVSLSFLFFLLTFVSANPRYCLVLTIPILLQVTMR
jgi:hypothetical protein